MEAPRCFISYSWDSEPHRAWVRKLATRLRESGIDAILDQFHCAPGMDLTKFMEKSVREADFVLLVCTPNFSKKADAGAGGVGYEKMIVTGEMLTGIARETKFVPLLREGDAKESLPSYLKSRLFIDFCEDAFFENRLRELLSHLYSEPLYPLPPIGSKPPSITKQSPERTESSEIKKKAGGIQNFIQPPMEAMVEIPVGEFIFQDDKAKIKKAFMIDVYPVTNSQFRKFIEAGGYKNFKLWSEEGQAWIQESRAAVPKYWDIEKWNREEYPVVGVSFFEAEAYAKWSGKRLPTEIEWERAARGKDGQRYPWGKEFDLKRCNTKESGILGTNSVTRYPKGVSLAGCYDMAGNIWEWCQDWYSESKSYKILRGGSWTNDHGFARCTYRYWHLPRYRFYSIGFRCAKTLD